MGRYSARTMIFWVIAGIVVGVLTGLALRTSLAVPIAIYTALILAFGRRIVSLIIKYPLLTSAFTLVSVLAILVVIGRPFLHDAFKPPLNHGKWSNPKGSASVENGWLVLKSAPKEGAELQSIKQFKFKSLEVKASSSWKPDTSIGFEDWVDESHYAIVVTNGNLGIINTSRSGDNQYWQKIPNWSSIKDYEIVLNLTWHRKRVELAVEKHPECAITYEGPLIPEIPLKVRLNASNDHADQMSLDYVTVR